jgi:hypothetical protein
MATTAVSVRYHSFGCANGAGCHRRRPRTVAVHGRDVSLALKKKADRSSLLADKRPDKALTYFLRLKQSKAIDLIRQYSLFPNVQDQIVLLVEQGPDSGAISLLVDHTHSIPVGEHKLQELIQIDRVVRQLEARPEYLFRYLKALFEKEPPLCFPYSDQMVRSSMIVIKKRSLLRPRTIRDYCCRYSELATRTISRRHIIYVVNGTSYQRWSFCLAAWGTTAKLLC